MRPGVELARAQINLYEATVCSATGEALLKRRFNGDFGALLAWWRAQRQSALAQQ
jgi:hypothetical protein